MFLARKISIIFFSLGFLCLALAGTQGKIVKADGITPTPTIDRLAKPTLPANPDMADKGAQDYWLYCSPCHGDKAQGLTDDFRMQYPKEDQYCWNSGCHGKRPYPNGWTIPRYVPALVGENALKRFPNGAVLKAYIQLKMPFQTPGNLKDAEYWRLAAFLLKQNGYWDGQGTLDEQTAQSIVISADSTFSLTPTPTIPLIPTPVAERRSDETGATPASDSTAVNTRWFAIAGMLGLSLLTAGLIKIAKKW